MSISPLEILIFHKSLADLTGGRICAIEDPLYRGEIAIYDYALIAANAKPGYTKHKHSGMIAWVTVSQSDGIFATSPEYLGAARFAQVVRISGGLRSTLQFARDAVVSHLEASNKAGIRTVGDLVKYLDEVCPL